MKREIRKYIYIYVLLLSLKTVPERDDENRGRVKSQTAFNVETKASMTQLLLSEGESKML